MEKIKSLFTKVAVPGVLALSAMSAFAQNTPITTGAPNIIPKTTYNKAALATTIINILNYILGIVALIAVAMILYAGYSYITAGMDDTKLKTAKNSLLYGVIGLIVAALAFAIVSFAGSFLGAGSTGA